MLKKREAPIRFLTAFVFTGLLTIFISCGKSPRCWGGNKNEGIISSSVQINCWPAKFQENYIITSDSAYLQIFSDTSTGCNRPPIDFSKFSLLGQSASGQCEIKVIREVTRSESENKYHYKVTVKSCGICKKEVLSDNWVIVPKLPDNWTVTFEVDEK